MSQTIEADFRVIEFGSGRELAHIPANNPQNEVIEGDCLEVLRGLSANSLEAIVTDPPAGISFMGKKWDGDKGGRMQWIGWMASVMTEAMRVLKPGGHALVWALPRTSHWTAFALEEAGFEVRDCITHVFGSGFPKSYDIAKGVEGVLTNGTASWNDFHKLNGELAAVQGRGANGFVKLSAQHGYRPELYQNKGKLELDPTTDEAALWAGWGSALKPASEHWWLARKPLSEKNLALNVLKWGTGGINIDASRIGTGEPEALVLPAPAPAPKRKAGRFPANFVMSHTLWCEPLNPNAWGEGMGGCAPGCPVAELDSQSGITKSTKTVFKAGEVKFGGKDYNNGKIYVNAEDDIRGHEDEGGASRFFPKFEFTQEEKAEARALFLYQAKPSTKEKNAGCEDLPKRGKVFNGQSEEASAEPKEVEARFNTEPQGNHHPTVKSTALMSWLIRLITPPGGTVLDMFAGSGSTLVAAKKNGFDYLGIEQDPEYVDIIKARLSVA